MWPIEDLEIYRKFEECLLFLHHLVSSSLFSILTLHGFTNLNPFRQQNYSSPSSALSSFLNKLSPPSQISSPSNGFEINKPPGLLPSDVHAISYPHCGKGGGDWRNPSPELFISCSISKRFCLQWKVFDLFNKMRYILLVVALLEACDVTNNGRHLGFCQELETRLKPR